MQSDNIHGELSAGASLQGSLNNNTARMSGSLHEGFGGTSDYNELENKPSINGVTLEGELSLNDLGILQPVNYSVNEQNTHVKWYDYKDIYKKSIVYDIPAGAGDHIIETNVTDYIDKLVNVELCMYYKADGSYQYSPAYIGTSTAGYVSIQNNNLTFNSINENLGPYRAYITIFYTKK